METNNLKQQAANYKIKVTAENREAIKDIAERNKMNPNGLIFDSYKHYYFIENNIFRQYHSNSAREELTFEQFKAMFDKEKGAPFEEEKTKGFEASKQETDLDKWLREIKAKNLSLDKLWNEVGRSSAKTGRQLKGESISDKALILYNQWNELKDEIKGWSFCEEKNSKCTDNYCDENGCVARKRILTEPEKTFKEKVIEVIEETIKEYQKSENEYSSLKAHFQAQTYKDQAFAISQLLKEIKELN